MNFLLYSEKALEKFQFVLVSQNTIKKHCWSVH